MADRRIVDLTEFPITSRGANGFNSDDLLIIAHAGANPETYKIDPNEFFRILRASADVLNRAETLVEVESYFDRFDRSLTTGYGRVNTLNLIGTITSAQIGNSQVTISKMAPNSVGTSQLVNSAVNSSKIADGAITSVFFANGGTSSSKIADGAVGSAQIRDGSITALELSDNSVSTNKIQDSAISASKIANGTLTGAKIARSTITTDNLSSNSVTNAKIANGAVDIFKVAENAIGSSQIRDGAVQNDKLQDANGASVGAVSTNKIRDRAVDNSKIAINTIQEINYLSRSVSNRVLADDAVSGIKIRDGAVSPEKLSFPIDRIFTHKTTSSPTSSQNRATISLTLTIPQAQFDTAGIIEGSLSGGGRIPWYLPFSLIFTTTPSLPFAFLHRGQQSRGGMILNTATNDRVFLVLSNDQDPDSTRDFNPSTFTLNRVIPWNSPSTTVSLPEPIPYSTAGVALPRPFLDEAGISRLRLEIWSGKRTFQSGNGRSVAERPWILQLKSPTDYNMSATSFFTNV